MREKDTPLKIVRQWMRLFPNIYAELAVIENLKAEGQASWGARTALPLPYAYDILKRDSGDEKYAATGTGALVACYLWRKHYIIYNFDEELAHSLAEQAHDTQDSDSAETEVLLDLPFPCVYVKCSSALGDDTDGFFAYLCENQKGICLVLVEVSADMEHFASVNVYLADENGIKSTCGELWKSVILPDDEDAEILHTAVHDFVFSAINLLLYIISDHADIEEEQEAPRKKSKPSPTPHKPAEADKAQLVRSYNVGVRIGAALRKATTYENHASKCGSGSSSKRPHSRRGHWHHFWIGSHSSGTARKKIVKWVAPTIIHPEAGDNTITVIPVRSREKRKE